MGACCVPPPERKTGVPTQEQTSSPDAAIAALAGMSAEELPMVELAGGVFLMGSDAPEAYTQDFECPVREVVVEPFRIAATTVSNAEFAKFVGETGYRTEAETFGDSLVFGGLLSPSLRTASPVVSAAPWWYQVQGATWLEPHGPGSTIVNIPDHPVTHVSQNDALAYAQWKGVRLLTETEWEFAARGGLEQQPFPWGSVREPDGTPRMNTFQGQFPNRPQGLVGTVATTTFEPNGYRLFNMTGNVWEWTSSPFRTGHQDMVMRGGSYMCHESYCRRYRTSARSSASPNSSLGHTGFRVGSN